MLSRLSARPGHPLRVGDSVTFLRFRETALYNDHYRRVGLDHAVAPPLWIDDLWPVSFVLNRRRRDFSERERDVLELLRGGLSALYRQTLALKQARRRSGPRDRMPGREHPSGPDVRWPLAARERDVLRWLARGKADRDIAAILRVSPRTVHKHLQRLYAKLGVDNCTAAVMRALGGGPSLK